MLRQRLSGYVHVAHLPVCALVCNVYGMQVSPINAEAVAWLSCQPYLVACFFSLCSLGTYASYRRQSDGNGLLKLLSVVAFLLACFSKAAGTRMLPPPSSVLTLALLQQPALWSVPFLSLKRHSSWQHLRGRTLRVLSRQRFKRSPPSSRSLFCR